MLKTHHSVLAGFLIIGQSTNTVRAESQLADCTANETEVGT